MSLSFLYGWKRLWRPVLLTLMVFPLFIAAVSFTALSPWYAVISAAAACVTVSVSFLIPGRWRVLSALLLTVLLCAAFLASTELMAGLILLAPALLVVFILLPMAAWSNDRAVNPSWEIIALAGYGAVQIAVLFPASSPFWKLPETSLINSVSFVLYLLCLFLVMNHQTLLSAVPHSRQPSLIVVWRNRVFTVLLCAAAVFVSLLPQIGAALEKLLDVLLLVLKSVVKFILSLFPSQTVSSGGNNAGDSGGLIGVAEESEQGLFAVILEWFFAAVAIILLVIALIFAVRKLCKLIRRLAARLVAAMSSRIQAAGEDYTDEIRDTREDTEESHFRHMGLPKPSRERNLPPRERLRSVYRKLLRRHPEWSVGTTARESLSLEAADLYELARYSTHEISDDQADAFSALTRTKP